ncbi:hypothetical protein BT69DRAFT_1276025 [Atractiella rhizophila]|nr:hypothetical protein BT69DRAFT_1276025 [Atractiella rhizophila]
MDVDGCKITVSPRKKKGDLWFRCSLSQTRKDRNFIVKDQWSWVVTGTSPSPLPPLIRLAKQSHALGPKISLHKKGYCVALEPGEIYRTFYDCKVGKSELWPSVEFAAILIS